MNWHDTITKEDVSKRERAHKLSERNPAEAHKVARSIPHPWYRCQALSAVAESESNLQKRLQLIDAAVSAAREQTDPNRVATVSACPLRVLLEVDMSRAQALLVSMVRVAREIENPVSRVDALLSLLLAVAAERALLPDVLPSFADAVLASGGWKNDRTIRDTLPIVSEYDHRTAQMLASHHGPKRQGQLKKVCAACSPPVVIVHGA